MKYLLQTISTMIVFCIFLLLSCEKNESPDPPKILSKPSSGFIGHSYNFIVSTEDPNEDSVAYQIDWGDGSHSVWSNFIACGLSFATSSMWQNPGDYIIKARAKDPKDATSDWSNEYHIIIYDTLNNPPNIPSIPAGPTTGQINSSYSFSTTTTDPEEDNVSYQFDWGNGVYSSWSDYVASGTQITMSRIWTDSGTYAVRARAKDTQGHTSDWSNAHNITIIFTTNHPPNTPTTPSGSSSGYTNTSYSFSTSAIDPDGDSVAYQFDWGDGTQSNWSSYKPSGVSVSMSKSWVAIGSYLIKARAKDVDGAMSDWSSTHTIVIDTTATGFPNRVVATISGEYGELGVAVLPNGNYVYVSNHNDDYVSVIRTLDNTLIGMIYVGYGPMDMAVLPNGNYIYVPNRFSDNVSVIRTSDNTVVASITVGDWPTYCAATPNGNFVYVTNWGTDNVSVIRTSDNTVVATIPVGDAPIGVCILPNGNYAYISNAGNNYISVIRTSDNTVVASFQNGNYPQGLAASSNGAYVYVANKLGNSVTVIRTSDNTIIATIPVSGGPDRLCFLPNGNYLYVTQEYSTNVVVIRTADNTVVGTIPVGVQPQAIIPLPNGNYLYVANFQSGNVKVIGY